MKNELFHFKKFTVRHARSSMKVGTDGVLLGAWVNPEEATTILDIGTGSGVIALMLAQRTASNTRIEALEINEDAYRDAEENFRLSPWPEKLSVYHSSLQEFKPEKKYNLIVCNPPYFQNSLKPPDKNREVARHSDSLPFEYLLHQSRSLLSARGRLCVILPFTEGISFIERGRNYNFYCSSKWEFQTREGKPTERLLIELSLENKPLSVGKILLYNKENNWSDEYRNLTEEFYLRR